MKSSKRVACIAIVLLCATTLHNISGSEKISIKGAGGSITLDGGGITIKGNLTIMGSVAIVSGGGGGAEELGLHANDGSDICIPCILKG